MKLLVSKPSGPDRTKHLILRATSEEEFLARPMINRYVLGPGVASVRERTPDGVTYRFHKRYLNKLLIALPDLDLSKGIRNHLYREEAKRQAKLPTVDLDLEGFRATLRPYQTVGSSQIVLGMEEGFMLNDDMGLGKTVQVLAALHHTQELPALVICPNSAKYVWAREAEKFTDFTVQVVDGNPAERDAQIRCDADIIVANFEQIRVSKMGAGSDVTRTAANPAFFSRRWQTLVCDEFHNLKSASAQQTQGYLALRQENFIGLSGTPIINTVVEIWPTLHKIDPEKFPNPHQLSASLKAKQGNRTIPNPEEMEKLKKWIDRRSLRRRKDQVAKDLPKVIKYRRDVVMSREQRKLYDQIRDDFRMMLEDGSEVGVPTFLAQLTRLKQACFSPELYGGSQKSAKIDELKDVVATLVSEGQKALVFSQWSKATRIIERELAEYNPAYVDGSVKGSKRMAQVDKFEHDPTCKIYVGTIKANKEAISLGSATTVIFTDKGWTPAENEQALSRSAAGGLRGAGHRKGTKVSIIELYAQDTVEERIEALLAEKADLFRRFIESDGGPAVQRRVLTTLRTLFQDEMRAA